jgi:PAS domain S-box-containing protein
MDMDAAMHTRTVLIVDEDRAHCEHLIDVLDSEGYRPIAAGSCAEAALCVREQRPAIALLDLKLPDGTGLSLIAEIKTIDPDCVCVIATASCDTGSGIGAIGPGAQLYLRKPLRPKELLEFLRQTCEMITLREEKVLAQEALRARNEELEFINARLHRMVESSKGLAACSRSGQIGPRLLEEFSQHMAAEGGSLFMISDTGLILEHHLGQDSIPELIPYPLRKGTVLECAMSRKEPLLIQDIFNQSTVMPSGGSVYRDGSLLVFPLPDDTGEIIAILTLHNKTIPPFTLQDLELGRIFASFSSETLRATRALEALSQSEERYRLLAENVDDVIWTAGLDMRLTYVSQSVTRLLGYAPDEFIMTSPRRILSPDSFTRSKMFFKALLSGAAGANPLKDEALVLEHIRKDGSSVWTESRVTVLRNAQQAGISLLGVTRDISARRRAESDRENMYTQLLQAQKMEAIGILAAGLAHDFNNLLTTIKGYVDLILMKAPESDPAYGNLRHVHNAAVKATELTRQLLLFSRKQPMQQTVINLNSTVDTMLKMIKRLLSENITIITDFAPGLLAAHADEGTIEQVIMNLVVNARDAMPQGGAITIRTENAVLSDADCRLMPEARPGTFIKLAVSDTGSGMDPQTLERIFEPFFTTKAPGTGTGLGLAVVYGIVTQHKGWIHVTSTPGHGSTFTLFLPADDREPELHEPASPTLESLRGNGETVLLVEDHKDVMEFCAYVLRENGYTVITAENFEQGIRAFEKASSTIRLALNDVVLPDRSGIELADELCRRKPGLPVILASGYTDEKALLSGTHEKRYDFLQKPYTVLALLQTLKRALA